MPALLLKHLRVKFSKNFYPSQTILATILPACQVVSKKYQLKKYERTFFLFNLLDTFSSARRFTKNIQVSAIAILTVVTNPFTFFDFLILDIRSVLSGVKKTPELMD